MFILYCAHGDSNKAYTILEGTAYCDEHMYDIINAVKKPIEPVEPTNAGDKFTKGFF